MWTAQDRFLSFKRDKLRQDKEVEELKKTIFEYDGDELSSNVDARSDPDRVLEFLRSPKDFEEWLEFILDEIYGDET